jgi:hypothetical protein
MNPTWMLGVLMPTEANSTVVHYALLYQVRYGTLEEKIFG